MDYFEKIKQEMNKRHWDTSFSPTADEVHICWLITEVERLRKIINNDIPERS
jgi:hypothetical protein